jgi:hypothetical protein
MPKGPRGERRPADVVSAAVMVGRIATGEFKEVGKPADEKAIERGKMGGKARAAATSKAKRKTIASNAAKTRWAKVTDPAN